MNEAEVYGSISVNDYNDGEIILITQLDDFDEPMCEMAFTRECAI